MSKKRKQRPWRLGGRDAPRWLQAPCADAVKRSTKADLDLLIRMFDFQKLDAAHPLRVLWELSSQDEALAEARFEFHHLVFPPSQN